MFRLLCLAGLVLLGGSFPEASAESSFDLTPLPLIRRVEGAMQKVVQFRGRGNAVLEMLEYSPPWTISGAGDEATMHIPGTDAVAGIYRFDTAEPLDLQDGAAVVSWIKQRLPREAAELRVDQIKRDPLLINGQATVGVRLSYNLLGRPVVRDFLVARRTKSAPTEIISFELVCQPKAFLELHRAFLASLYSLVGF